MAAAVQGSQTVRRYIESVKTDLARLSLNGSRLDVFKFQLSQVQACYKEISHAVSVFDPAAYADYQKLESSDYLRPLVTKIDLFFKKHMGFSVRSLETLPSFRHEDYNEYFEAMSEEDKKATSLLAFWRMEPEIWHGQIKIDLRAIAEKAAASGSSFNEEKDLAALLPIAIEGRFTQVISVFFRRVAEDDEFRQSLWEMDQYASLERAFTKAAEVGCAQTACSFFEARLSFPPEGFKKALIAASNNDHNDFIKIWARKDGNFKNHAKDAVSDLAYNGHEKAVAAILQYGDIPKDEHHAALMAAARGERKGVTQVLLGKVPSGCDQSTVMGNFFVSLAQEASPVRISGSGGLFSVFNDFLNESSMRDLEPFYLKALDAATTSRRKEAVKALLAKKALKTKECEQILLSVITRRSWCNSIDLTPYEAVFTLLLESPAIRREGVSSKTFDAIILHLAKFPSSCAIRFFKTKGTFSLNGIDAAVIESAKAKHAENIEAILDHTPISPDALKKALKIAATKNDFFSTQALLRAKPDISRGEFVLNAIEKDKEYAFSATGRSEEELFEALGVLQLLISPTASEDYDGAWSICYYVSPAITSKFYEAVAFFFQVFQDSYGKSLEHQVNLFAHDDTTKALCRGKKQDASEEKVSNPLIDAINARENAQAIAIIQKEAAASTWSRSISSFAMQEAFELSMQKNLGEVALAFLEATPLLPYVRYKGALDALKNKFARPIAVFGEISYGIEDKLAEAILKKDPFYKGEALCLAAKEGFLEGVEYFLGSDLQNPAYYLKGALTAASRNGHTKVVEKILEKRKFYQEDLSKALDAAVRRNQQAVTLQLLPLIYQKYKARTKALEIAISNQSLASVRTLCEGGLASQDMRYLLLRNFNCTAGEKHQVERIEIAKTLMSSGSLGVDDFKEVALRFVELDVEQVLEHLLGAQMFPAAIFGEAVKKAPSLQMLAFLLERGTLSVKERGEAACDAKKASFFTKVITLLKTGKISELDCAEIAYNYKGPEKELLESVQVEGKENSRATALHNLLLTMRGDRLATLFDEKVVSPDECLPSLHVLVKAGNTGVIHELYEKGGIPRDEFKKRVTNCAGFVTLATLQFLIEEKLINDEIEEPIRRLLKRKKGESDLEEEIVEMINLLRKDKDLSPSFAKEALLLAARSGSLSRIGLFTSKAPSQEEYVEIILALLEGGLAEKKAENTVVSEEIFKLMDDFVHKARFYDNKRAEALLKAVETKDFKKARLFLEKRIQSTGKMSSQQRGRAFVAACKESFEMASDIKKDGEIPKECFLEAFKIICDTIKTAPLTLIAPDIQQEHLPQAIVAAENALARVKKIGLSGEFYEGLISDLKSRLTWGATLKGLLPFSWK